MPSPERPPIEGDVARLQARPARNDVEWRASRAASDIAAVVATLRLPPAVAVRAWEEIDFSEVQRLSAAEGRTTPIERAHESLVAWRCSWPALVAVHNETVIGFSRALSDGVVTTYIAELLVVLEWRGRGIATALLQASHRLCPGSRLDLLATSTSRRFYEHLGFRPFAGFRWSGPEEIARAEEQGQGP
jgi:GNAT superfamily N-acetyltransferase